MLGIRGVTVTIQYTIIVDFTSIAMKTQFSFYINYPFYKVKLCLKIPVLDSPTADKAQTFNT